MTLWFILGIMTAAALGAVIWPLARARAVVSAGSDLAVYRDQLEEIERDRADGRIGHEEFEAARVEVSRRLLGAAASTTVDAAPRGGRRFAALAGAIIAVPLIAASFYVLLGSPDMPGEPLASRETGDEQASSIAALIAKIETHLEENPTDGRGWEVVAPVYMRLERYDDAVKARRNALNLLGATAQREVDLGEALTFAAGRVVTADSKAAFERAAAMEAGNPKALFYLGLAAQQDGNGAEAARIWRNLIAQAPADAPWLSVVRQSLAGVEGSGDTRTGPGPDDVAAASEMPPEARNQFIRGMVERLATRLHENGSDVEGWLRLLRAYMVMGERDKAKTVADEAREALAREPEKLKLLDEGIKDLGVGG
jgi:cytochrome c-type biogenesis protein CcmH